MIQSSRANLSKIILSNPRIPMILEDALGVGSELTKSPFVDYTAVACVVEYGGSDPWF
jgi:hypothetical protein